MRVSKYAIVPVAAALLMASPALAEVTPEQVWEDFSGYLKSFGYEVNASEALSGDTLTLSDLRVTMALPEANGAVAVAFGSMELRGQGDGSVKVVLPETVPISVTVAPEDEDAVDMEIGYSLDALDMVVSGDPEAMTYVFSAEAMAMALSKLVVDGKEIPRDGLRAELTTGPVEGEAQVTIADGTREVVQTVSIGTVSYDVAGQDPEGEGAGMLLGSLTGLVSESLARIPAESGAADMPALLAAGMTVSGKMTYDAGQSQFSFTEEGQTTSGQSASAGGSFEIGMSKDALMYDIAAREVNYSLSGGEIPFPVSAAMEEMKLTIAAPISKSDTPRDVALALTLGGFTTSDMIWNIFDPAAVLPRDPATVAFDLTGKVTPFVDFMDPAQLAGVEAGSQPPGELNALTLNSLTVEAAGAKITGTGDFTFDNTDLQSFDGMPKPTGALDLQVAGANGLIDKLIQMGLVAEQDAMGARMMMSMFGVPGSEPDTLTSKIEVNEQGHVLANGQRIK